MPTKQEIVQLLISNPKAIARALVVLNERQTLSEQSAETTINHNGVGFTPADARMGTSMAQFYTKRGYLSEKQIAYWLKPNVRGVPRICKYAGQLVEIAAAKKAMEERVAEKTEFARQEARQEAVAQDIGNMAEELMVLEEMLANETLEYNLYIDSDDEPTLEKMNLSIVKLQKRIDELKQEINQAAASLGYRNV